MGLNMILPLVGGLAVLAVLAVVVLRKKRTAYLGPVKEELQKEKAWLRRGEYNAAMVKGRQNLELLLKLVAEKNGIQLDNTAKAQADAREEAERRNQNSGGKNGNRGGRKKEKKVMTHHQFNRWLSENGYLDRVARWEMNQVRIIGNKAVHENYGDKDDAWNQYNYLEDILKTVTERSQNPGKAAKHQERKNEEHQAQPKVQKAVSPVEQEVADAAKKKRRRRRKKPQNKQGEQTVQNVAVVAEAKPQPVEKKAKQKAKPAEKKAKQQAQPVEKKAKQQVQPIEKKAKQQAQPAENKAKTASVPVVEKNESEQAATDAVKKKRRRRRKKPQNKQGEQAVQTAQEKTVVAEPKTQPTEKKTKQKAQSVEKKAKDANVQPVEKNEGEQAATDTTKKKRRRRRRKPQNKQSVNEHVNNSAGEQ